MKLEELKKKIEAAGVIGAGGAGFPTHMKLASGIDTVLVNASECEPLLYTDFVIMQQHMDRVSAGAQAVREALGAKQVVIAMKSHTAAGLSHHDGETVGGGSVIKLLPDVYPIGDEIILIYQSLGRIVPPGQLPSSVGVVVINVETAYNVFNSLNDVPVTEKWLTIGGKVEKPMVVKVPINCEVKNVLKAAGVTVPEGCSVVDGGPAMGGIINPDVAKVTKKTKSLLVLPNEIPALAFKRVSTERVLKRTSSACCQCTFCTDMCPRHLLGYPIQPHKTLRAVGANLLNHPDDLLTASLCCGCSVCTLMACCQGITPSVTMFNVKRNLGKNRLAYRSTKPTVPDPQRDNRMVPAERFKRRIGVIEFDRRAEYRPDFKIEQTVYTLALSQHVGKPSVPIVKVGDEVTAGQMIAQAAQGISAALHTPVAGKVTAVTDTNIEISAGGVK
ncbi:MAG TPA: 4Fe-4S dicluster domain-containing protein [Caproiciproducens sp.]|nr:4Fe-4S dicluster domain-containing protein [Caproiciproducens sp.]